MASLDVAYFNGLNEENQGRLLQCLKSGIENPGSEMGCYAMHPTDYDRFKPFFRKALEKYHKVNLSKERYFFMFIVVISSILVR